MLRPEKQPPARRLHTLLPKSPGAGETGRLWHTDGDKAPTDPSAAQLQTGVMPTLILMTARQGACLFPGANCTFCIPTKRHLIFFYKLQQTPQEQGKVRLVDKETKQSVDQQPQQSAQMSGLSR